MIEVSTKVFTAPSSSCSRAVGAEDPSKVLLAHTTLGRVWRDRSVSHADLEGQGVCVATGEGRPTHREVLGMSRMTLPILLGIACADVAGAKMPPELVEVLERPEVPATARTELETGGSPVWILERDTSAGQISVVGVIKLSGSPQRVSEDFFQRHSLLEADLLKASGTFSEPAVLGDVAKYQVPESDLEVLADCEIHACKFKLGARALAELGAIDWDSPDARAKIDALVRGRMVEFVAAYQREGRTALGRYVDKPDARSVPEATGLLLDQIEAKRLVETVRTHLLGYPKTRLPGARDRLHWNVRDYGYRPVTSIVHTVAFAPGAGEPAGLIAAETLYSSHYFDARLQLLVLYTDTENPEQTYALYGDRMLFDDEVGSLQRRLLRSSVVADVRERLEKVGDRYHSP
jgi:hypothetical protein